MNCILNYFRFGLIVLFQLQTIPVKFVQATEYFDLSYSFNNDTIYFPGQTVDFELHKDQASSKKGHWYATYSFCMAEHGGTHVDAPFHFNENGWTLDEIPLERMIDVPATVIDVQDEVESADPRGNFTLQVKHLIRHETDHGQIPFQGVVLLHTGWGKYWPDKMRYLGWDNSTGAGAATLNFPGCSEDAAKWLVNERHIVGFGIDTPSVDIGNSEGHYPVHILFGEKRIYNIENVANLHLVSKAMQEKLKKSHHPCALHLFVLPIKITGATGGPTRVLAYCKYNMNAFGGNKNEYIRD